MSGAYTQKYIHAITFLKISKKISENNNIIDIIRDPLFHGRGIIRRGENLIIISEVNIKR